MRFQRVIEQLNYRPWFITAEGYASVKMVVDHAVKRIGSSQEDWEKELGDFVNVRPKMEIDRDGIATIHIVGILGQKMSNLEKACGNTGYEQIISEIEEAVALGARAILFIADSPGGMAIGSGEPAEIIAGLTIPTAAFTDSLACSACYYQIAGCDYIVSSRSAIVGSIGTILPWVDQQKMWDIKGLTFDPITNTGADLKDSLHGPSMNQEHRDFLQDHVDDLASQFQNHVDDYRMVDEEVWRAGFYVGDRAVDMNLVDDVGSVELAREWLLSQMG